MIVTMKEYEIYMGIYSFVMGEVMKNLLFFIIPLLIVSLIFWIIGMASEKSHKKV